MKPLKMVEIKPAAARLFDTRDGKLVMEYLQRTYYDAKLNSDNLERECGRRDVIRNLIIMTTIEE